MKMKQIEFINKIEDYAVQDMKASGIAASLTVAQACLESGYGSSKLTTQANNLFGIKGTYQNQYVVMPTKEYQNGAWVTINAKFRKYPSWAESLADHSAMFNRMDRYKNIRGETDYKRACMLIQQDGYASDPDYSNKLISIINKYVLYELDDKCIGKMPGGPEPISTPDNLPVLKNGSRGEYVLAWQKFLNLNGYPCGNEDGIFGINTCLAVKQWQTVHGLVADGIIGQKTWASIGLQ